MIIKMLHYTYNVRLQQQYLYCVGAAAVVSEELWALTLWALKWGEAFRIPGFALFVSFSTPSLSALSAPSIDAFSDDSVLASVFSGEKPQDLLCGFGDPILRLSKLRSNSCSLKILKKTDACY